MRNPATMFGNSGASAFGVFKVLASVVLALSMSASSSAQDAASETTTSVDKAFSALHQALSAAADDLLATDQPSLAKNQTLSDMARSSALGFELRGRGNTDGSVQLRQAIERVQKLRTVFEPILREEGIPEQLAAVVLVESGGRNAALSPKGARGLWQFMPDTARRYGLVVRASQDERLDPYKSTRAAARYLHDLYTQFGNWPLALAAYNVGEDAVQRALERFSTRDFSSIARPGTLPRETRNYVPAVLRAMEMLGPANIPESTGRGAAIRLVDHAVATREN